MKIGIVKEIKESEYRVGAVPTAVTELVRRGHEVFVETKAGVGSGFSDEDYKKAGAVICDTAEEVWTGVDMIYKVKESFPEEFKYLRDDLIVFTYIHSNAHPEQTQALMKSGCTSIAYEDISDDRRQWPLLSPMSELAGKGGFLAALHFMQTINGGPGKLLANVCGAAAPVVTIIGCGHSGLGACELAAAFGCQVYVLDINYDAMLAAKEHMPNNVSFLFSNRDNLIDCLKKTDVLINCILWPKTRKDHLVNREDLKLMKPGAMIVDVACDDEGAIEPFYVIGACQMIRREAFEQVGYLDEAIFYGPEDADFCQRLRQAGWQIKYLPQYSIIHTYYRHTRHHPLSRLGMHHIRGLLHFYNKYGRLS